jgi:hydroxymethylglutaryl-CoA reductase (NADPH)
VIKKKSRTDQSEEARLERVRSIRERTGKKLAAFSVSYLNSENLSGNIENFIGSTSLPLGLSGPLKIHFATSTQDISAAFATSEGALISSITRGVLALNLSGGLKSRCIENTVTRAPVFLFQDLDHALNFQKWLPSQLNDIKAKAKEYSKHAVLLDFQIKTIIQEVHVVFIYSTGEAAGQNMTTLITAGLVQYIRQKYFNFENFWIEETLIEGNLSSDKKISNSIYSNGRGRKVIAQALMPAAVVKKVLKVSSHDLCKNFNRMKTARVFAGYQGFNINVSNVVAGLFLATGQDAACIHESSAAELHLEMKGDDLFVSLYMPSLIVGTVGGGTHLPHAQNCLELMDCSGPNSADKLAEIICAYALALELSTVSAIEAGHFVDAHSTLGRDQKKNFRTADLNADFLNSMLLCDKKNIKGVVTVESVDFDDAMMMDLASISARRISGLFRVSVHSESEKNVKKMILKIKNSDSDLISASQFMLQSIDMSKISSSTDFKKYHPFLNSQKNEIEVNAKLSEVNWTFLPKIYISKIENEVGFILQDEVLGAVKKFKSWSSTDVTIALNNLSDIHMCKVDFKSFGETDYVASKPLWIDLATALMNKKGNQSKAHQLLSYCVEKYDKAFSNFSILEKRFCHLDYNPRNLLFTDNKIFVIDWEFAGKNLPQRDLVEFLIFNFSEIDISEQREIIKNYPKKINYPEHDWKLGLQSAFCDFVLRRISLYLVIAEFKDIYFLEDLISNSILFINNHLE